MTAGWTEHAACRGKPTSWWYPTRGEVFVEQVARQVCAGCQVTVECLDDALDTEVEGERFGIRGGLSVRERSRLARERRASVDVAPATSAPAVEVVPWLRVYLHRPFFAVL